MRRNYRRIGEREEGVEGEGKVWAKFSFSPQGKRERERGEGKMMGVVLGEKKGEFLGGLKANRKGVLCHKCTYTYVQNAQCFQVFLDTQRPDAIYGSAKEFF